MTAALLLIGAGSLLLRPKPLPEEMALSEETGLPVYQGLPYVELDGNRPSSLIIGEQLNPETLGSLLAHFENKVMFQGFVWNLNSFDQEGVQLGKLLAKRVLAHETDGALRAYSDLMEI